MGLIMLLFPLMGSCLQRVAKMCKSLCGKLLVNSVFCVREGEGQRERERAVVILFSIVRCSHSSLQDALYLCESRSS